MRGKLVGRRDYSQEGYLWLEIPIKNGMRHGTIYDWYCNGILNSSLPYVDDRAHGIAKQWAISGKLMGTYKMMQGTGIDLWRGVRDDDEQAEGPFYLAEAHYEKDGHLHGFTWWLNEDQKTVFCEEHYFDKMRHGIFRQWNVKGRLCRSYPQYYVKNEKVDKRKYLRACRDDESLPGFVESDNKPARVFPPEIQKHLLAM